MSNPVEQIKAEADIVELISEIIPVKKSGANYVALCPFHNDSKPSMYISQSKGIYKCFSCGAGGDLFKFWSEYYQKDFRETLKDLAEKYGIELNTKPEDKESTEKFNLKIKMHEIAAKYYQDQLMGSNQAHAAREYIANRKFATNTISEFKLGYSPLDPNNWNKLISILKEKLQVTEEQIVDAGLALKSEKAGTYYDRFRGRLMIPIQDERSRVVAFGARSLPGSDDKGPKYMNSPETQIYHKGSLLFGINLAKEIIRSEDAAILVEGYFDVTSLVQAGIKNVVANQGTALTPRQVKLLSKFSSSKRIYLCFDTDKAGEDASNRAAELISQVLEKYEHEIRVIRVPGGKDPDEFIHSEGAEAFRELIKNAPLFVDYQVNKIISETDKSSPQAKAKAIKSLGKYLSILNNQVVLSEYIKIISEKLNTDPTSTRNELNKEIASHKKVSINPYDQDPYQNKQNIKKPEKKQQFTKVNGHLIYIEDAVKAAEQEFLILALRDRTILEEFMASESSLISKEHQTVLDALVDINYENPQLRDANQRYQLLSNKLSDSRELSEQLADLGVKLEQELAKEDVNERYHELLRKLKESRLKMQIKELKSQMQSHDDSSIEWLEMQKEKLNLEKEMQKLKAFNLKLMQP